MAGALEDVRVIDFTHVLNGPFCTMLLGHLGAQIIKIEPPDGDHFRRIWMAPDAGVDGYEFLWINANKKSVVLNLKTPEGLGLARRLIADADVLVENFGKGVMERLGLDYEAVSRINPRLIYACSRGYGEWGPYSNYGSNAGTNNGMAGWTHTAWKYNDAPGTKALGIGDEAGGVSMAVGILAALHARERTGVGQKIEVAMQEAVLGFMISSLHEHFTGNKIGSPQVQVADGYFTFRTDEVTDEGWKKLAPLVGHEELANDAGFATRAARREHRDEIDGMIRSWMRERTRQEVWDGLRDLGYFGGPVLSLDEVMNDPHVKARGSFIQRDHATAGPVTFVAPWIRMSDTPATIRDDSPAIGEHTNEVLSTLLGLSAPELDALRAIGAIK